MGATSTKAKSGSSRNGARAGQELTRIRAALDGLRTPVMMIDRDFIITYANPAIRRMFSANADVFRSAYPGFDPNELAGQCVDALNSDPAQQRRILADPASCPHKSDVVIGPFTFELSISAIVDANGTYVGNCLEWKDVKMYRIYGSLPPGAMRSGDHRP